MIQRSIALSLCILLLAGCSSKQVFENAAVSEAHVTQHTRAGDILMSLPPPAEKLAVAVYDFQDQTGQFKNNGAYTDYSSAVTKGGYAILIKALLDAGNRQWFTVTERGGLKNLLQERQIINVMRNEYQGAGGEKLPHLPPLVYGGVMIEGGIISYDSNIITGGVGATYLGIGATAQYHRDMVTVALRAVAIQTGEVLLSVTSSKTIFSTSVDTNLLKYIAFDRLLQAEGGFTVNEPTELAVNQAIETAVYSLIMEGTLDHLWSFKDAAAGQKALNAYLLRRDGKLPRKQMQMADNVPPQATPQTTSQAAPQTAPRPVPFQFGESRYETRRKTLQAEPVNPPDNQALQ